MEPTRRNFLAGAGGFAAATAAALMIPSRRPPRKPRPAPSPSPGAVLFEDDFNGPAGSSPSTSNWRWEEGGGGWGNGESEVYTDTRTNSYLDGQGNLAIVATEFAGVYNSARMVTLRAFGYGTYEARIKLGVQPGLWPAFWAVGSDWPRNGELDVLENYGGDYGEASVHTPKGPGSIYTKYADTPVDDNWHTWSMTLNAAGVSCFKDGARYLSCTPSQIPAWCFSAASKLYVVLNLAVGGAAGSPLAASYPAAMLVDYVRVSAV